MANTSGSARYTEFLKSLGRLLCLEDCPRDVVYLGGLDQAGTDGCFAYFYEDDITQVVFHVATLMPNHPGDLQCNNKKLHIGNDFVTIVYNNSSHPYAFGTIKGQFNFAEVVIQPLPGGMNRVHTQAKKGLEVADLLQGKPSLISDLWLPVLVREKALQANLASLVHLSQSASDQYYLSNWLGRLRHIKRIREKVLSEQKSSKHVRPTSLLPDFTCFS